MTRAISIAILGFAIAIQAIPAKAQHREEQPLILATGEWEPFASLAYWAPFKSFGRAGDVVVHAFYKAGYTKAQLEFHSFGDAYDLAREGAAVAAFPYYRTTKRQDETVFSDPLMEIDEVIFYNKNDAPYLAQVTTLDELITALEDHGRDFRQSARFVKDYCYHEEVEAVFGHDCEKEDARDLQTDIHAFQALQTDPNTLIVPSARQVGERILNAWFGDSDRIGIIEGVSYPRGVFLLAQKGPQGEEIIARFNSGLKEIRSNGLYKQLVTAPLPEESVPRDVQLTDPGTFPLIVASRERKSDETLVLPRGTAARVVQWSQNFHAPERTTLREQLNQMSLVMIMDGPQRGELLWVKNVFIALD